jgi:hypothetical protein
MNINRRFAQLFKRAPDSDIDKRIGHMPEEYQNGYYNGFVRGRDLQREADITVATKLVPPAPQSKE